MTSTPPRRTVAAFFLSVGLIAACDRGGVGVDATAERLEKIAVYGLEGIDDPSGIDYADGRLFVVGDRQVRVHALTPDGVPIEIISLTIAVDKPDIEGIAVVGDAYLLAEEGDGAIFRIARDRTADDLAERLPLRGAVDGNSGLEGLTVRRSDGHIFAVKEKKPTLLYHLDPDGREIDRRKLDVAPDVAGITHLGRAGCPNQLLAVSQQGRALIQITTSGLTLARWPIDVDRPEGVAFDGTGRLYIVDEARAELVVFAFEGRCR